MKTEQPQIVNTNEFASDQTMSKPAQLEDVKRI